MKKSDAINVGFLQSEMSHNQEDNIEMLIKGIRNCADKGARLVVLPELHNTHYFCQLQDPLNFDLAEPIPGPSTRIFGDLAKELGVVLVLSLFEKRSKGMYHNTVVVIESDGSIAGKYRKMHIPDDPGYYEKYYFTPGDLGFEPIQTSVGRFGVMICWDQWFPEAARIMTLRGADLLIYPTAIGWDPKDTEEEKNRQLDAWVTIQRSHAIANALPVVSVNRTGFENDPSGVTSGIEFWGHSFVVGPQGEILKQSMQSSTEEMIEIDLSIGEQVSRIWPFLRDRRVDFYKPLTELSE